MAISLEECESLLSSITAEEQTRLLSLFGHELTILARTGYEFQGPGVTDPRLLRDLNEIQHRVFGQLMANATGRGSDYLPADVLASWLLADNKLPRLKFEVAGALERAIRHFRAAT